MTKKLSDALRKSNAKFKSLPVMQQRVEICKDALLQIRVGKYDITRGRYFEFGWDSTANVFKFEQETDAQKAINMEGAICEVCARGAIFASRCRLGNDAKNPVNHKFSFDKEENKTVVPIFNEEMLLLIEYLFEEGSCGECPYEYKDVATRWLDTVEGADAKHRMKLLLKNIIRNKGKLVLYHKTIQ